MNRAPDDSLTSLSFDWSGAEIISDSTQAPFTFVAKTPEQHAVISHTVVNLTMENDLVVPGTAFEVADVSIAAEWQRGDVIKVIANNVIPGSEPGPAPGTNQARVGEFLVFHSVSGSSIRVIGTLIDSFTDNVRLCKLDESIEISMKCGKLTFSEAIMSSKSPRNSVILRNLVNARLDGLNVRAAPSAMITNEGCYRSTFENVNIDYGIDNPGDSNFSYGIVDKASAYTRILNAHGRNLRHLYTDDTSAIAANSVNTHAYGATMFAKIIDSTGQGSSAAPFDTHHASYGAEFHGCSARDSYFGFQLRGRMGRLVNARASFCTVGGRAFEQTVGGETYDSTIMNWESDNCLTDFEFMLRPPGHPLAEQRQDKWFVVDGFTTRNTRRRGLLLRNASVRLMNYRFSAASDMIGGGCSMTMRNSRISIDGAIEHDFSLNVSGAALSVIELNTTWFSVFESGPAKYRHPASTPSRVAAYISSAGNDLVRVREQSMTQAPDLIIANAPTSNSYLDWSSEANSRSSAGVLLGTTSMASAGALAPLGRSMKSDLTALIDPSGGNGSLAGLPAPQFDGQRLAIIHYGSSNTVSISHDTSTAARRALIGNTGKSLTPGQSMLLVAIPGGVWKQVTPVA
ncbi:hypothetical protein C5E07_05835 [Pseudoclavibacter sp. RFBJ3]|nr:hypothetical protein C5B99_08475 [Pseudoclavibacter sp. Z016]PPF85012.1 hypothetical protein C5C12_06545 [Pseudoclavibacter sp. RFBJ5]PPF94015.1 hypothetical protein C5E07_05835 [Pseudoclavibacter sp. RFBJ3]PPF98732.1 hypothetical protein C5C19_08820 [Pseudoclavibacter sp. RFBH5]PPG02793.1 hypothetical protein C5E06_10105 [Pseudoclavibacter sp. RFBI5]PPG24307.1 hypothetical protein C5E13_06050 [Pseudoclavibacter sp. RFBI4]